MAAGWKGLRVVFEATMDKLKWSWQSDVREKSTIQQ